jgi:lipid II:glycine glycyltransferase (peptidoglycan interpeptide bridge formation enzyme)
MEIKSLLTGRRGVSLPFTDECRPVARDSEQFKEMLRYVFEYGKTAGWKHLEFRGGHKGLDRFPVHTTHYCHTVELDRDDAKIFSTFRNSNKRNIKRARKENLTVDLSYTLKSVKEFYRLNCTTRKHHGLPPQPFSFFRTIFDHIISRKKGFVALACNKNRSVAAAVYFHFGTEAVYKYGASDRNYHHLRPNNLMMWQAIKWCCRNGFKRFSFGRTEPENHGLLQFKRGWGTKEDRINYYKYDLAKDVFVRANSTLNSSYNLFKIMPLPLLRLTGNFFYRHVG